MPDGVPESQPPPPAPRIREVRYSLPEMLSEIELERSESSLGMETLDQTEIRELFAKSKRRHARDKK
ncbi:MAG TPA: hypothetical protein VMH36_27445 [Alphaproteobacteria bacterium]|nr:hypothetical protein [Alphaproteobacteria bacterium]